MEEKSCVIIYNEDQDIKITIFDFESQIFSSQVVISLHVITRILGLKFENFFEGRIIYT